LIQLIGIKSDCDIETRQKFSIVPSRLENNLKHIKRDIGDAVILSTCNRTEVYVDSKLERSELVHGVFEVLGWDDNLMENVFYVEDRDAVKHLMEVGSGFHSRILGEDQILGQIKSAYQAAIEAGTVKGRLHRLFQSTITCGKKFKNTCRMYEIPVSVPSITVKEARDRNLKRYMILGFGQIGQLVLKYILSASVEKIYVVVRNINKIPSGAGEYKGVQFITFRERKNYYEDVDCIISCTSAPHAIIGKEELPSENIVVFDLAVPRDVNRNVMELPNIELYDIDSISRIDEKNKNTRRKKMLEHRYIICSYIDEFVRWQSTAELSPEIQKIKRQADAICRRRVNTYVNKKHTKDNEKLVRAMVESTARLYVDRAIEVLKEEKLKGRENECIDIINRIFCNKNYI